MSSLRINRVLVKPVAYDGNSMYVEDASTGTDDRSAVHCTNSAGDEIYSMLSHLGVDALITAGEASKIHIVEAPDIAARDALVLASSVHVRVLDATADPVIDSGSATYYYNMAAGTFTLHSSSDAYANLKTEEW